MKQFVILVFLLPISYAQSATYFFYSDTIEPNEVHSGIEVYCTDEIQTVIDMNGGNISGNASIYDFSQFNMYGGTVDALGVGDNSSGNIYDGNIGSASLGKDATLSVYGGIISGLLADDSSPNIYGGDIGLLTVLGDYPVVTINGGQVDRIIMGKVRNPPDYDNSIVHIKKATITDYINVISKSSCHIYGNNFSYDNEGGAYGNGQLTGEWYDGTPFTIDFFTSNFGNVILHYPEVIICQIPIPADMNGDCKVDLTDFGIFCSYWLDCNLYPIEACN